MTDPELMNEHRVIFETRLGILGYGPKDIPSADHHNLAHDEAEAHIAQLRAARVESGLQMLRDFKNTLWTQST